MRPSKFGPKTMEGSVQEPRERGEEEEGLVELVVAGQVDKVLLLLLLLSVEAALAVVSEELVEDATPVLVPDAVPVIAPPPTAFAISSAVTSGTSRFCVNIHPIGSLASSP